MDERIGAACDAARQAELESQAGGFRVAQEPSLSQLEPHRENPVPDSSVYFVADHASAAVPLRRPLASWGPSHAPLSPGVGSCTSWISLTKI